MKRMLNTTINRSMNENNDESYTQYLRMSMGSPWMFYQMPGYRHFIMRNCSFASLINAAMWLFFVIRGRF